VVLVSDSQCRRSKASSLRRSVDDKGRIWPVSGLFSLIVVNAFVFFSALTLWLGERKTSWPYNPCQVFLYLEQVEKEDRGTTGYRVHLEDEDEVKMYRCWLGEHHVFWLTAELVRILYYCSMIMIMHILYILIGRNLVRRVYVVGYFARS